MLPKERRYLLRKDKHFFLEAKKLQGSFFTIFWRNSEEELSQAAVVVPKTVSRKSTERNRLKRLIRILLSSTLPETRQKKIVVYVRRSFSPQDLSLLKKKLTELS